VALTDADSPDEAYVLLQALKLPDSKSSENDVDAGVLGVLLGDVLGVEELLDYAMWNDLPKYSLAFCS
jgi:hypothetical protein